jgi:hypothetical protein
VRREGVVKERSLRVAIFCSAMAKFCFAFSIATFCFAIVIGHFADRSHSRTSCTDSLTHWIDICGGRTVQFHNLLGPYDIYEKNSPEYWCPTLSESDRDNCEPFFKCISSETSCDFRGEQCKDASVACRKSEP